MKKLVYYLLSIMCIVGCLKAQSQDRQKNINSIFNKMEIQGVDTKKPLLYGYFFYDKDKTKLEKLRDALLQDNYRFVRLEKTKKHSFILHVEKIEIHTRTSLLERESQLDKLSKRYQVETYDGWDVGNEDPTKPMVSKDSFEKTLENKSDIELYKIANDLYENDIKDVAIVVFQKCIERNYRIDSCYYKQGVSYITIGQLKIGVEKLEESLKINPKNYKACYNIGTTCYETQEYQKSIEYYEKALKLGFENDRVYYGIAASQFVLGQLKDAEINCLTALKLNPNNENAKTLWGYILIKREKR